MQADKTKAKGVSLLGVGGGGWWSLIVTLMGGGGLLGWISNIFKPSRATNRINDLEMKLAEASKVGSRIPTDTA